MTIRLLLFFLFFYNFSFCQPPKKISTSAGDFTYLKYAENIVKITFTPKNYHTNEHISDAVILQPRKNSHLSVHIKNDTLYIGNNKIKLLGLSNNVGYKGFQIILADDEKIYGGGERALPLNRRGYKFNLYNNPWYGYEKGADNLNYAVPFFTSSNGYGLFFDNVSKGYADIGNTTPNILEVGFVSGELNVFVIFGKDYKEILSSYHNLTGTQPLPPRWALGNFMSRFGYTSEQQVMDIAGKMKKEYIPFDAIIFDLFWFGDSIKGTMGNLEWINKSKWPDPKRMIQHFKKQNIQTILITEPFILQSSLNYNNSLPYQAVDSTGKPYVLTDFYFGKAGLIDIFRKDAQQWFWEKHAAQMKNGVEAWWGDLGEPEKHPANLYHQLKDYGYQRLFGADEVHNMYGHTWTKLLYEQYQKQYPNKRLFSLNRSGFAGTQRYGIFPWSGDVSRSWNGLKAQLPIMLGMSMSGVPYIHADAGGFAGGEGDIELYVRWLQFAAFTPIFRPHGTALFEVDKNAFSYPSEPALMDEPYRSLAKASILLRYRLLPYNYTLAYQQAVKGAPLVAPLYYHYPDDSLAKQVEDEYMWGENILVAPVIDKAVTTKKIFFPEGKWYNLCINSNDSVKIYEKGAEMPVDLNTMPVFVKAGSFIPMCQVTEGSTSHDFTTDSLVIHYYYDKKTSQYTLFDDDGETNKSIAKKQFELISMNASTSNDKLIFQFQSNRGKFNHQPAKRNIQLMIHGKDIRGKKVYISEAGSKKQLAVNVSSPINSSDQLISFDLSDKFVQIEIK